MIIFEHIMKALMANQ